MEISAAALCLWMLLSLLHYTSATPPGLDVIKSPKSEEISLETDMTLFLSFTVCGSRQSFSGVSYSIRIRRADGTKVDITPLRDSLLVRDELARRRGVSVSLWNTQATSPEHQQCVEVPIRVWKEFDVVKNSSIELILYVRRHSSPIPLSFKGGKFSLHSPPPVQPAAAMTVELPTTQPLTEDEAATATTAAPADAAPTTSNRGVEVTPEFVIMNKPLLKCLCYC